MKLRKANMKDRELKPCPFCGGGCWVNKEQYKPGVGYLYSVHCPTCHYSYDGFELNTEEKAIKAWNTRTRPSDEQKKDPWIGANSFDDVKDNISKIVKDESKCKSCKGAGFFFVECGDKLTTEKCECNPSPTTSECEHEWKLHSGGILNGKHHQDFKCKCGDTKREWIQSSTTSEVEKLQEIIKNIGEKGHYFLQAHARRALADKILKAGYRLHPEKRELDEKELTGFLHYRCPRSIPLDKQERESLSHDICQHFAAPRVEITKERIEHIIHRMTSWHSKDNYFFGIPYNKECPYCNDNLWLNNIAKAIKEELEKEK